MAARMPAAERRALLIDAAISVMSREGVPHTTTRAIVAEAGMQIGVFHYCFRSKEELVLEVMREINQRSTEAVTAAVVPTNDPAQLIQNTVQAYWSHIESNPLEHLLTYELTQWAMRQPGGEADARAQYDGYFTSVTEILTAVAGLGGFEWRTPVDVLCRFVLAILEGVTFQWVVNRDDDMARALLDKLVSHLLHEAGIDLVDAALS